MIIEPEFQGKWVIIKDKKIIAADEDFKKIRPLIKIPDPEITIGYIPGEDSFF